MSHCCIWYMRYVAKVLSIERRLEKCLVNLTGSQALPLRMRTGKAGRRPGCQVRDKVNAAHLVSDVGLAAHEVGRVRAALSAPDSGLVVPDKAGVMAPSATVLARVSIGASPIDA